MIQGWYQGGISVFDWTDPAHPKEIAFFDRGPMDSTKLVSAGSWSAYWYNGMIVSSEIGRGLDILELTPSDLLTQNEIDAANTVKWGERTSTHCGSAACAPGQKPASRASNSRGGATRRWNGMTSSPRAGGSGELMLPCWRSER